MVLDDAWRVAWEWELGECARNTDLGTIKQQNVLK